MDALTFLREEYESVDATLKETLRHDYGPERSKPYFEECRDRLDEIRQAFEEDPGMDHSAVAALVRRLSSIGTRISLIERSHLGEFSWPFAGVIRTIADTLFTEDTIKGERAPIVHVVAEGMDYQIVDDDLANGGLSRIIIVAFPRQLKHHVLIHAIFGHELGHTAYNSSRTGATIQNTVLPSLMQGVLQDPVQARAWLDRPDAPDNIRLSSPEDKAKAFDERVLHNWRQEILSDMFGLLLFGPAFAAAHRTVIEALCSVPDAVQLDAATHPPYPIRQHLVSRAMCLLGWDVPCTKKEDGIIHVAERRFLEYVTLRQENTWFDILSDAQLRNALDSLSTLLTSARHSARPEADPRIAYSQPPGDVLGRLVDRLSFERPPIDQTIGEAGIPINRPVPVPHCLYAGWTFWFGRGELAEQARLTDASVGNLSFLDLNRLCNQAMLQQEAIDLVASYESPE